MIDRTGMRFGRLTVVGFAERRGSGYYWNCVCDCGNKCVTTYGRLHSGHTTSCGCARKGVNKKHGMSASPTYRSWRAMIQRCKNPNNNRYENYAGRGLGIAEEWMTFENFFADMGERPSRVCSIERVDNDRGYCKDNCTWVTHAEQSRNKRTTRWLEVDGVRMCLSDAAKLHGLAQPTLWLRLSWGWGLHDALTRPSRKHGRSSK